MWLSPALPEGVRDAAALEAVAGKNPLIRLSRRPPNYETPIDYFRHAITPDEAFFIRYHLSGIPSVDAKTWRLSIAGEGAQSDVAITLDELKSMASAEIVAVNQCSGNRRGLFQPHVAGVQWGYGAMGCARWRGVRLKDLIDKVGVKKETMEVSFVGADRPAVEKTPAFVKSIPLEKALEDSVLVAYEMNGEPLPALNGFPARIIVPGWTATYWMKHLVAIKLLTRPEESFWMRTAYRLPKGKFPSPNSFTSQETESNVPITDIMVNSLIAYPVDGAEIHGGVVIEGVAWDGGTGVKAVDISLDDGKTWAAAQLGEDLGRFAFRAFSFLLPSDASGKIAVTARATNNAGETQGRDLIQNPGGYHHNRMQTVTLNVI
ncbi:MAG: molybdopterin-dependent oxidoreductase [Methylocystis sp.]|uniref:molybdopterin-dependent oxidoreductase n=1 Tax=Methylocystis sp. TaxID=1911079 RepID=UPI0039287068